MRKNRYRSRVILRFFCPTQEGICRLANDRSSGDPREEIADRKKDVMELTKKRPRYRVSTAKKAVALTLALWLALAGGVALVALTLTRQGQNLDDVDEASFGKRIYVDSDRDYDFSAVLWPRQWPVTDPPGPGVILR